MLPSGLYAIADADAARAAGHDLVDLVARLLAAGVPTIQLRVKAPEAGPFFAAARRAAALCREAGALFVVNDRVDVAALVGAGGVHLGQDDLPVEAARRLLPRGVLVGVSTHTPAEVEAALAAGADYLGFGPIFPTGSKARPDPVVGLEGLRAAVARAGRVPVVAIGGLGPDTLGEVARTGARAAAVIAGLLEGGDPEARARALHRAFLAGAEARA